jgi:hypothetical protein
MGEYLALFNIIETATRHSWPSSLAEHSVSRFYFEADNLDTAREFARKQRHQLQWSTNSVSPATIYEKIGLGDDQKPIYEVRVIGQSLSNPDLNLSSLQGLHLVQE